MSHVGILYLGDNGGPPQWWWDSAENVVYFGDPNLRMYVPSTEFSDANNWERPQTLRFDTDLEINGHVPFGSTAYPHKIEPKTFLEKVIWVIVALVMIILLLIAIVVIKRK